jgi:hypothetical protein
MTEKKIKNKLNKFINQTRYLESYLTESEELLNEYQEIFSDDFKEELDLIRIKNTSLDVNKQNKIVEECKKEINDFDNIKNTDNITEDINIDEPNVIEKDNIYKLLLKKIYRKLAIETHPDKNNGRKTKLFYKIEKYYNNNNLLDLLTLANDFEIDILLELDKIIKNIIKNEENIKKEDILDELFINFNSDIDNKNNKIENIKKTVAWEWGNADNEDKKFKIKKFLYNMWEFNNEDINYLDNLKNNKK